LGAAEIDHPATAGTALLIIDMINDLEFAGGECMLNDAQNAAQAVAELSRQARSSGVPVVYVNDN
jgi:nicotinamidase-related amidase